MISACRFLLAAVIVGASAIGLAASEPTLPQRPEIFAGYENADTTARRIASLGPRAIEGIWSFTGREAIIAIERTSPAASAYRMVIIRTPDRAIRPGTQMGLLVPSGSAEKFDATLYTSSSGSTLSAPKRFTLSLIDSGSRITFARVGSRYSIEPIRLLPYMFRRIIRVNRSADRNVAPAGCVRIFPAPVVPDSPVYL
ncbi:MAG: hypothetical protein HDR77_04415 [Bacteroides sp.]|nr:hypothetical protein [Bacteroides sp.]MBD5374705.1 hypothetical protein [Bacteroides sp.]